MTRESLRGLYGAASFKFVTSIVALACSVLYLAAEKLLAQAAAGGSGADQDRMIARAHVHAILASRAAAPKRTTDTSWVDTKLPARRPTPAPPPGRMPDDEER